MSKHIHDGRSHCPACALEKIGWQKQEIADLEAENARLQARDNCEDGQGWLSREIECRRDGFSGPTCHKHTYESLMGYKALAELTASETCVEKG